MRPSSILNNISRHVNEGIKATEWYQDYWSWFKRSTQLKELKKRRDFKNLTYEEKEQRIEWLFYEMVLPIEKDKFYYYLLSYEQEFIIIKSGNDVQSNRDFLGDEFKKGRQAGMVVYRDREDKDQTALHDEDDQFNQDKVNYYIYQSFLENLESPAGAVKEYISSLKVVELLVRIIQIIGKVTLIGLL